MSSVRALALLPFAALLVAGPLAAQELPPEPEAPQIEIAKEATTAAGLAAILVRASVHGADVSLNRVFVGRSPYANDVLAPGLLVIGVSSPGYHAREFSLVLEEKTRYVIDIPLVPLSGFLSLAVTPADAELFVDGERRGAGVSRVAAGSHAVKARRFGYTEQSASVQVLERSLSTVTFALQAAPFELSALSVSRRAFNPRNAGALGRTEIGFRVTARGSARMEIRDAEGKLVGERDFPAFSTWEQGDAWDGRGPGGEPLPDGVYRAVLVAQPAADLSAAPAAARGALGREIEIRIDSAILIRPSGVATGLPGLLLFPDARVQPAGVSAVELTWIAKGTALSGSAAGVGAAISLGGRLALGASAAVESAGGADAGADLAAGMTASLRDKGPFVAALVLRGSWSSAASPVLPGSGSSVELALPLAVELGPLDLGIAPALLANLGGAVPEILPLARAAAWTEGPTFRAGLSARLAFFSAGGSLAPAWPAELAAEGRWMLSSLPFVATLFVLADLSPSAAPAWRFGLGLGLIL